MNKMQVVSPKCTHCGAYIGSMLVDDYVKALEHRGPCLCPSCRDHKCDACNQWSPETVEKVYSKVTGEYQGALCSVCHDWIRVMETNPTGKFRFFRSMPGWQADPSVMECLTGFGAL